MSNDRRRPYDRRLRAARAAATRRRIIDVAVDAFAERGYAGTTMADVARGAGVSVDTVHANGPKSALLQAAVRIAIFGVESDRPIEEYEVGRALYAADGPATFLEVLVDTFGAAIPRTTRLWAAFEAAANGDAELTARRDELLRGAVETLHTIVGMCRERGWLSDRLTVEERLAALYSVATPGPVHFVMRDLTLDADGYRRWMRRTVEWALFDGDADRAAG